jgi:hypothetical protein
MAQTKVKLISDGVIVQGNLHPSHGITTADIGENASYLYYTDARVGSYLSTNSFATESYVGTQIANLVDSSPSALNTLNELAAALGDDANFSTTVTNSIALKAPLASPSFTGNASFAGNVGIGQSPYSYSRLSVEGSDNTSSNYAFIAYSENTNAILACRNDGQVTMPTGNVGIGVSTVNNPFTAQAALQVGDTSTATNNGLITIGSGTTGSGDIYFADGTSGGSQYKGFVSYKHNGDYLAFGTAETTRMIIDSSGQLNLSSGTYHKLAATFPSTYETVLQIGLQATISAEALSDTITFAHSGTEAVSDYVFKVAGNPKLIIKGTGNVGIGTTLPTTALTIRKAIPAAASSYGLQASMVEFKSYYPGYDTETVKSAIYSGVSDQTTLQTTRGFMSFWTADYVSGGGQSLTEKMRIESNGNVGIGTASPVQPLHVNGQVLFRTTTVDGGKNRFQLIPGGSSDAANLYLYYGNSGDGTLSVRINAQGNSYFNGGNVGIGTTSPSTKFQLNSPNAGAVVGGTIGATIYGYSNNEMLVISSRYDQNLGGIRFKRGQAGSEVDSGSITFTASGTSFNTSSDYRLKEDLQDFAGLDMVSKIPVYDFKWKTDKSRSYGVMAHELQEILPLAVTGEKDAEKMQGVDYSKIIPLLVKSIQELKAEIETLKTQING